MLFYNFSIGNYEDIPLIALSGFYYKIIEGSGAIYIWSFFYDLFSSIGIDKIKYVGIGFNSFLVSLTAVIGNRIYLLNKSGDKEKAYNFYTIFSLCGIVYLFASIHIRDAFTLFLVTYTLYIYCRALSNKNFFTDFKFYFNIFLIQLTIGLFRQDFIFLPVIFYVISLISIIINFSSLNSIKFYSKILFSFILIFSISGLSYVSFKFFLKCNSFMSRTFLYQIQVLQKVLLDQLL